MMENKFIGLMVGLTVGVLMVSGFLWPIVSDATATQTTFKNDGLYYMTNPVENIHVEFLGDGEWVINDAPLDYEAVGSTNIIVTDTFFVRNIGQVRGNVDTNWTNADITIGNGTITGTATISGASTAVNYTYEWVFVATTEKAEALMKDTTDKSYITATSKVIGAGISTLKDSTNTNRFFPFQVEVDNLTATVTPGSNDITVDNIQVNITPIDGYIGLYEFVSVTFDATYDNTITPVVYNRVIVPAEVTAEKSSHLDTMQIAMIGVIGTLGAIVLIAAAAGSIRRLD